VAEPIAPVAPGTDASADQLAAWRESQAQWKIDHDEYRREQAETRRIASAAAASAAGAERAERAAAHRERLRRTRSHPLYSLALIGTAVVAGAITTLSLGSLGPAHWLVGGAVALGLLGLGIIVNGIIGRRSGGASAVAVILAVCLLFVGIFPQTSTLTYIGNVHITPESQAGTGGSITYLEGVGSVTLDLTHFYSTPRPKTDKGGGLTNYNQVNLLVASGNVVVELPADEYHYISARTADGHVTTPFEANSGGAYDRQFNLPGDKNGDNAAREFGVNVHVLRGNITIIEEENGQ
jgi:hypothetical protein